MTNDHPTSTDTSAVPEAAAGTGGGVAEGEGASIGNETRPSNDDGSWPTWRNRFLNDFKSAKEAKANDGMRAPEIADPAWGDAPNAASVHILEAARRRHDQALDRIDRAEERAHRLVQLGLSLLALAFLAAGFVADRLSSVEPIWFVWAVAGSLIGSTMICFVLTTIQAAAVDRVGYVQPANPSDAAELEPPNQLRNLAVQEYRAARMANWTGKHKVNDVLQAQAWLTRGLASLFALGTFTVVLWAVTDSATSDPAQPTPSTTVAPTTRPSSTPPYLSTPGSTAPAISTSASSTTSP